MKITFRNTEYMKWRAIMVLIVGLVVASIFWQFNPTHVQVVMGVIFQGILYLDLGLVLQLPVYMDSRPMFYKQRAANFYSTPSYVTAQSVAQLVIAALEALLFGTIIYWMCGFVSDFSKWLIVEAMILLTNMALAAFFFFMAAFYRDLNVVTPMSLVATTLITMFSGFHVSKDQVPSYMSWAYWINPISWCVRGVAINLYRSGEFDVD